MKTQLLIPAAGMGVRLGHALPKALVPLGGVPLLARTLTRFIPLGLVENAVIVLPVSHRPLVVEAVERHFPGVGFRWVDGGPERQDSVGNGLAALDADTECVVIHDAARPFIPSDIVQASCVAAEACGAATVAIPCQDTILEGDGDAYLVRTPSRANLWSCQTPQTFRAPVIREAHGRARREGFLGTDDASLVRRMGGMVKLVMGSPQNIKITTPADLSWAEWQFREGNV